MATRRQGGTANIVAQIEWGPLPLDQQHSMSQHSCSPPRSAGNLDWPLLLLLLLQLPHGAWVHSH